MLFSFICSQVIAHIEKVIAYRMPNKQSLASFVIITAKRQSHGQKLTSSPAFTRKNLRLAYYSWICPVGLFRRRRGTAPHYHASSADLGGGCHVHAHHVLLVGQGDFHGDRD